jgi:filamentous hemagglutinin
MPASPDSSATAADFATRVLGRQLTQAEFEKGASMNRGDCEGCWIASSDNGKTFIVYRPAGKASPDTLPTTSTAEINNEASTNSINNGNVLKLKFPQLIDNP